MLLSFAALMITVQGEPAMGDSTLKALQTPADDLDAAEDNAFALGLGDPDAPYPRLGEAWPAWRDSIEADARWTRVRDTNTDFEPMAFDSLKQWEDFAENLRRRMLVGCGLYPLPERTPPPAEVDLVAERPDYSVYTVAVEASPGFYVTGNLYRPTGDGPFPAVVCPHGHWERGRLENSERGSVPARCVTLARMGVVAFSYDMIGYNDSLQFSKHSWGTKDDALWGIHPFGVQLWSSIRALDFLENLPDVDAGRLACTGASGGGTQTFALCAVDQRVKVSAPVNMISHTMQGGCPCENAPLIRLGNSNMEIGALMAPRPMLMVSATGDWTRETPQVEYPAIQDIYGLYGAANLVENVHIDAGHNYNQASREAVYRFFGNHLLGQPGRYADFTEPPFDVEPDAALRLFPDGVRPDGWPSGQEVIARWKGERARRAAAQLPAAPEAYPEFRRAMAPALRDACGLPPDGPVVEHWRGAEAQKGGVRRYGAIIGRKGQGDRVPVWVYTPEEARGAAVCMIEPSRKRALLRSGLCVVEVAPFPQRQGLELERSFGAFPETFLPTNAAYGVHDILTALDYVRERPDLPPLEALAGEDERALQALYASALEGRVPETYVNTLAETSDETRWNDTCFIPGVRALGGPATAAALIAPRKLTVFGGVPDEVAGAIEAAYEAAGAPERFRCF